MLKWLLVLTLAVIVLGLAGPLLSRIGLGRLPGDFVLKRRGRRFYFPLATSLLLSLSLTLLLWVLRI